MKRKIPLFAVSFISALALSSCGKAPFDKDSFLSKLFPQPWDALAIFLAFIVLLLVAFYLAYKPVKKLIKDRQDYVSGKIKEAEDREEKTRGLVLEAEKNVGESKKTAQQIIEKAQEDANKQKAIIIADAKKEAELEKEKAKQEIAQEFEASKDEIHREIVSVAMDASSKVLGREVNDEDNRRLVDDFVKDLKKDDEE